MLMSKYGCIFLVAVNINYHVDLSSCHISELSRRPNCKFFRHQVVPVDILYSKLNLIHLQASVNSHSSDSNRQCPLLHLLRVLQIFVL